eukprot:11698908-Ditylum_brightwellii.AAC.1
MADVEVGSIFCAPAIPFILKASILKSDNTQEFTICMTSTNNKSIYKFKAYTFSNRSPEDVLEREKNAKGCQV